MFVHGPLQWSHAAGLANPLALPSTPPIFVSSKAAGSWTDVHGPLLADSSWTVAIVKNGIAEELAISPAEVRLFNGTTELCDGAASLTCLGTTHPIFLTLMRRSAKQMRWFQRAGGAGFQRGKLSSIISELNALKLHEDPDALLTAMAWHSGLFVPTLASLLQDAKGNYSFMMAAVRRFGPCLALLDYVGDVLWADRNFILEILQYRNGHGLVSNRHILDHVRDTLWSDYDFILGVMHYARGGLLVRVADVLRVDHNFALQLLPCVGQEVLEHAGHNAWTDRDFILKALTFVGPRLFHQVPSEITSDPFFMYKVVLHHPEALRFAAYSLRDNCAFVLELLTYFHRASRKGEFSHRQNKDLRSTASAFSFASARLRSDKGFVLSAVQLDGYSLAHASRDLRADAEVIFTAVRQCPFSICYAIGMETLAHELIEEKKWYWWKHDTVCIPYPKDCMLVDLLADAYNKFRQRAYRSSGRRRSVLQIASETWSALQRRRSRQREWRSAFEAEEAFWSKCGPKSVREKRRPDTLQHKRECDEARCAGGCGARTGAWDSGKTFDRSRGRALQLKAGRRRDRDEKF